MVGNDIVDLSFFELPKHQHIRYLERVCTLAEAEALRGSDSPGRNLAVVWAVKEAGYKLFSRRLTLRHFVPQDFVTSFEDDIGPVSERELRVSYGTEEASVQVFVTDQWVHSVATYAAEDLLRWRVQEVPRLPSEDVSWREEGAAVRRLARQLLLECGETDVVLEFSGRVPVLKTNGEKTADLGISLSHHGSFVAAAVAKSSAKGRGDRLDNRTVLGSSGEACSFSTA